MTHYLCTHAVPLSASITALMLGQDPTVFNAAVIFTFKPADTLNEFVRFTIRRFLSTQFLHRFCVLRNPIPGKVKLLESTVYKLLISTLFYSTIYSACRGW